MWQNLFTRVPNMKNEKIIFFFLKNNEISFIKLQTIFVVAREVLKQHPNKQWKLHTQQKAHNTILICKPQNLYQIIIYCGACFHVGKQGSITNNSCYHKYINFHSNGNILTEEIDIYKSVFFKKKINLRHERIKPKEQRSFFPDNAFEQSIFTMGKAEYTREALILLGMRSRRLQKQHLESRGSGISCAYQLQISEKENNCTFSVSKEDIQNIKLIGYEHKAKIRTLQ